MFLFSNGMYYFIKSCSVEEFFFVYININLFDINMTISVISTKIKLLSMS